MLPELLAGLGQHPVDEDLGGVRMGRVVMTGVPLVTVMTKSFGQIAGSAGRPDELAGRRPVSPRPIAYSPRATWSSAASWSSAAAGVLGLHLGDPVLAVDLWREVVEVVAAAGRPGRAPDDLALPLRVRGTLEKCSSARPPA